MENTYKIDFVHQVKSLRYVLVGLIAFIILFYIMTYHQSFTLELVFFVCLPIPLLLFGPAIYLHLSYLFENYGVVLSVDHITKSFVLKKNGHRHIYEFSDIISLEQHLGIYYRDRVDRAGRRIAPWTPYGYLNLRLKDGQYFNLTCIMVNIHNPPFMPTDTYFRFFPYSKPSKSLSEKKKLAIENFKNEVSHYKQNFRDLPNHQLEEKIRNYKTYYKASVEASRQILKSRKEIKQ
ncbi:hypothetical protein [Pedobacter namyangjuensis]|uniref:hypothetical protein n=1 Tax=Pedobacter namyangjuensis TaxID=600626 RepID=UPI000DE278B9|nr:hypothetical protein [Pedobacter namyangjuensis]